MYYNLGKKKIDLSSLSNNLADFFVKRHFTVSVKKYNAGYKLVARPKIYNEIRNKIIVEIKGTPNSFSVTFKPTSFWQKIGVLAPLINLFIGGYLFLRDLKSEEKLEKIEKEFWIYTNYLISAYLRD